MRRRKQCDQSQRRPHCGVLVVAGDSLVRRGIVSVISDEANFSVCGSAGDECTAVKMLERQRPDLLLLDLSLGHRDGLQFLKDIAARFADTRIIALSEYEGEVYVSRAVRAGASGYLTKRSSEAQLISTIRAVAAGKSLVRTRSRLLANGKLTARSTTHDGSVASLTDRELHVFTLIGAGLGTGRIAQELGLSRKTIETYREHIKLKLRYSGAEALLKGALDWARHSPAESKDALRNRGNPR